MISFQITKNFQTHSKILFSAPDPHNSNECSSLSKCVISTDFISVGLFPKYYEYLIIGLTLKPVTHLKQHQRVKCKQATE